MSPTFRSRDVLLVRRISDRSAELRRGDIVIADGPDGSGRYYLKRIAAMPGERIELRDGLLFINDEHHHEAYLSGLPAYVGTESHSWSVDDDSYFLMGDNRTHSIDSRDYGPVTLEAIRGKVTQRLWPPGRWRRF